MVYTALPLTRTYYLLWRLDYVYYVSPIPISRNGSIYHDEHWGYSANETNHCSMRTIRQRRVKEKDRSTFRKTFLSTVYERSL